MKYKNILFDIGDVLVRFNQQEIINTIFGQPLSIHMLTKEQIKVYREQAPQFMPALQAGVTILHQVRERGFRTYVLSNMLEDWYQMLYRKHAFFAQFDGVVLSCRAGSAKPDLAIYQVLLKTYGLKPEECLFLDDKEDNINAGKRLGIDGIVFKDYGYVQKTLQEYCVLGE